MPRMKKLDLYREHRSEYVTPRKPVRLEVGPAQYLSVTGTGAPASEEFQAKIGGLYGVAFTIKMTRKSAGLGDYKVCSLEGLWWVEGKKGTGFAAAPPEHWQWKLLIRVPDFIRPADLDAAKKSLREKKKPPAFEQVTLETIREGTCVQMLHVGPFSAEKASIEAMHAFAKEQGLVFRGPHHEIYLSDPRRVAPEKLRTILRHPVKES